MAEALAELCQGPAGAVWRQFAALCAIPRASGSEAMVRRHLAALAARHRWATAQDSAGNLVVRVPGHGQLADRPALILQAHVDMVCEKTPECSHDFAIDPIRPVQDGAWVRAQGTTLGADNGIGVALALALAEQQVPARVPLELLLTVDEETGLTGAMGLDAELLQSRRMINLDSEEDGIFTIGCAGGMDMLLTAPPGESGDVLGPVTEVRLGGLRGGHSGVNIHEGRGNAIIAMAEMLAALRRQAPDFQLLGLEGGTKKNAIPRDCCCVLAGVRQAALAAAAGEAECALAPHEPRARIHWEAAAVASPVRTVGGQVVDLILDLPNGVLSMDPHFEAVVETSSSLGVAHVENGNCQLLLHGRSSSEAGKAELRDRVARTAARHGAEFKRSGEYPGWTPNPDSALLAALTAAYTECFGVPPEVASVHAGLEAGIIGAKLQTSELVSLGPTIENAHSPDERLLAESVQRVYDLLSHYLSLARYHRD